MRVAIMQPYFFPYLGYYQLINAVDKFIIYDDVNFIKGGWINRNYILQNGEKKYITIPLNGASSFKKINEVLTNCRINKVLKTIRQSYSKAPYFKEVYKLVEDILNEINPNTTISTVSSLSLINVSRYLQLKTNFEFSSEDYQESNGLHKENRLIDICKKNKADTYINSIGGEKLYSKEVFSRHNINLKFIMGKTTNYKQYGERFISNLSIIDVLMFNSASDIKYMLKNYDLV